MMRIACPGSSEISLTKRHSTLLSNLPERSDGSVTESAMDFERNVTSVLGQPGCTGWRVFLWHDHPHTRDSPLE